jgi:hypothetical protein
MHAAARLEMTYASEDLADRMLASVRVDNGEHARSWREGTRLITEASAESPGALRHTLEDLLACLSAAEGAEDLADEG